MNEVPWDVVYLTDILFPYWRFVWTLPRAVPYPAALPFAAPTPNRIAASCQEGALFRKSSSTSLIRYARCLYTRAGNWKLFNHLKHHHNFMNPIFWEAHSFPRCLALKGLGSPSDHGLSPSLSDVTVPHSFTQNTWWKTSSVQPTSVRPVCGPVHSCKPVGRSPDEPCEERL